MSQRLLLLCCSAALVLLGACGTGGDAAQDPGAVPISTGSETAGGAEPERTGPACNDVWRGGARIPARYRGCLDAGTWVPAETTRCESGQVLVTYGDRYYGAAGYPSTLVRTSLSASAAYRSAVRSCG